MKNDKQLSLDELPEEKEKMAASGRKAPQKGRGPVFVLASNFSAPALFARGCLLPPIFGEPTGNSYLDGHPRALMWSRGPLPASWCEGVATGARNAFPIAIEVGRRPSNFSSKSLSAPFLRLEDVAGLAFRTEDEKKRFLTMPFEDFSLAGLDLRAEVVPGVFEGEVENDAPPEALLEVEDAGEGGEKDAAGPEPALSGERQRELEIGLRRADASAALLAVYFQEAPTHAKWMEALGMLAGGKADTSEKLERWPSILKDGLISATPSTENLDELLVWVAARTVLDYSTSAGWPSEEVLDRIFEETKGWLAKKGRAEDLEALEKWQERSRDVLTSKAEPKSLADDQYVGRRAVLLLLLRGDLEALASKVRPRGDRTLVIGATVRLIATCLAAIRTGLRATPADYKLKSESGLSRAWLESLGEHVLAGLGDSVPGNEKIESPSLALTYRKIRTLQAEWIVESGGRRMATRPADFDPALERLFSRGRDLGYELEEYRDDGLRTRFQWPDGRAQSVYIKIFRNGLSKGPVVRFWSPARELAPRTSGSLTMKSPAFRRVVKDDLVDLLVRNSNPDMNCRFAISLDEGAIIVLVDQLLGTLDDPEFQRHVEHVARVADDFEREIGRDDYR